MTKEQEEQIEKLLKLGYIWDKEWSILASGVILKKSSAEFWFFGLQGEMIHNPKGITIPL